MDGALLAPVHGSLSAWSVPEWFGGHESLRFPDMSLMSFRPSLQRLECFLLLQLLQPQLLFFCILPQLGPYCVGKGSVSLQAKGGKPYIGCLSITGVLCTSPLTPSFFSPSFEFDFVISKIQSLRCYRCHGGCPSWPLEG